MIDLDKTEVHTHDGTSIRLRPGTGDDIAYQFNVKTRQQVKHIQLAPDQVWLDCGAHIGAFSCRIAPEVERVVAVEGDPDNYELLVHNVGLNRLKNVRPIHAAVTAKDADHAFFYATTRGKYLAGGTLPKRGRNPISIQGLGLQGLIDQHEISHIKMSIEGSEGPIVLATNFFSVDYIEIEYNFWASGDENHAQYRRMVAHLKDQFPLVEANLEHKNVWHRRVFAWR